jgi:hypothetical protein
VSSQVLLASVVDNGDAAVLAAAEHVVDAGTSDALLHELMRTEAPLGSTVIRIVTTPDASALREASATACAFSAAGYPLDAIVVTRVPSARDAWPKAWAQPQRERVIAFMDGSSVPVLPMRLRPQRRIVPKSMPAAPVRVVPIVDPPQASGEYFTWSVPIDGIASVSKLRVGQEGGQLVFDLDGREIRRPLPSVLLRCEATNAHETESGLTITFKRDPRVWPEDAA